jgi:hypothetical protein
LPGFARAICVCVRDKTRATTNRKYMRPAQTHCDNSIVTNGSQDTDRKTRTGQNGSRADAVYGFVARLATRTARGICDNLHRFRILASGYRLNDLALRACSAANDTDSSNVLPVPVAAFGGALYPRAINRLPLLF